MKRFRIVSALSVLALSLSALAQPLPAAYPNKPVRVVVAFVPGGITDIVGRAVAKRLEDMGQPKWAKVIKTAGVKPEAQ